MLIRMQLFAILKERAGTATIELELPEPATVADALSLAAQTPGLEGVADGSVRMAVNRELADPQTLLSPGDEVALIPPVSGGCADLGFGTAEGTPRGLAAIRRGPLSLDAICAAVADPHAGALVSFQGLPRDIASLDYEAYAEMALEQIEAILADAIATHRLCRAAAEHRVGLVPAMEPSIIVAVSAPHRGEAFAGAREILDRIKAQAPIWKVEVDAAGGRIRVPGSKPV
jgi:molybdopterin synthase catalytic subunit